MMKHKLFFIALCTLTTLTACGGTEDTATPKTEETTNNEETIKEEAKNEEVASNEILRVGLGETVIVSTDGEDRYELTFDKAFLTDERNEYYENEVDNVVVLEYTYKNLGEESGTYIISGIDYKVYDAQGKSLETYPAGVTLYGDTVSVGRFSTAQEAFGFDGDANQTLEIEIYGDIFETKPLAIVEVTPE